MEKFAVGEQVMIMPGMTLAVIDRVVSDTLLGVFIGTRKFTCGYRFVNPIELKKIDELAAAGGQRLAA
jgi:hypothetical protein